MLLQVPFGKAAFFQGKLIHTNEFMVILYFLCLPTQSVFNTPHAIEHYILVTFMFADDKFLIFYIANSVNRNNWTFFLLSQLDIIGESVDAFRYRLDCSMKANFLEIMFTPYDTYLVYLQVLLGEGYYANRTSKQTIEILKRRGKDLESQIENLNGIIKDLKS